MIDLDNLIFKPIIPLTTMVIFSIVLVLIVLINRKHIINRILIILLLLIVSQRPMLKNQDDVAYVLNLDVIFVIDTTVSMNAVDINNGTRLDAVKRLCNRIMEEFAGSRFAVINYDNDAYIKYPFTDDAYIIEEVIDYLKIVEPNYAVGSSLSIPADFLHMLLDSSKNGDDQHEEKRHRIVFFMGDGELNNQEVMMTNLTSYRKSAELIDNGAVIGFGTAEGGKMLITSSINMNNLVDSSGYLLDNSKNPPVTAVSKINENNLSVLASSLNLDYFNQNSDKLDAKIEEIKNIVNEDEDEDKKTNKDLYYYFTGASLILMLYELLYYRRNEQ